MTLHPQIKEMPQASIVCLHENFATQCDASHTDNIAARGY